MLILWQYDPSFEDISTDSRLVEAASEILRSHRRGQHLVVIDRKMADRLRGLPLSASDQSILYRIMKDYTQTGGMISHAHIYISILNSWEECLKHSGSCIYVSIRSLTHTRFLDPPVLLTENAICDGKFYQEILKHTASMMRLRNICFELQHGGGQTTSENFRRLANERRIVVAVPDSDQDSPASTNNKISVFHLGIEKNLSIAHAASPPCREIENTIPLDLLLALYPPEYNELSDALVKIYERELTLKHFPHFHLYVDLKEGVRCDKFNKLQHRDREWIEQKLNFYFGQSSFSSITGFGDKIVPNLLQKNYFMGLIKQNMTRASWREAFGNFFCEICWYFVSSPATRT